MLMFPSYSPLFTMGLLADHVPKHDAAIYVTLSRDCSFLYLDLADNKWSSPSHRRKPSTLSKSTSWTCMTSTDDVARPEKPMSTMSPTPAVSARRRASKETLRSIPSPKPAPSTTLPDVPIPPVSPPAAASSKKRSRSIQVLSPRHRRAPSARSESVSSHVRRKSRMDALACLEGRSRAPHRVPRVSPLRNNFMSFSDDEDEKSTTHRSSLSKETTSVHTEDLNAYADVEDEVDAILPTHSRKREAADQVPARSARPARKRRSTIDSWFPLKSFIDLKDDDLSSWNWRSFIEIGGVA